MFGYGCRVECFISSDWIHMLMSSLKVNSIFIPSKSVAFGEEIQRQQIKETPCIRFNGTACLFD